MSKKILRCHIKAGFADSRPNHALMDDRADEVIESKEAKVLNIDD